MGSNPLCEIATNGSEFLEAIATRFFISGFLLKAYVVSEQFFHRGSIICSYELNCVVDHERSFDIAS
jgi:hypothetical protein